MLFFKKRTAKIRNVQNVQERSSVEEKMNQEILAERIDFQGSVRTKDPS